jgi:peptidoglycan/LPS O-acetylase OafA/YrhL
MRHALPVNTFWVIDLFYLVLKISNRFYTCNIGLRWLSRRLSPNNFHPHGIVLPMTLFLSVFSYHYVEKPILGLRRRYGSHRL